MTLSLNWYRNVRDNRGHYLRINYIIDYSYDFIALIVIILLTKSAYYIISWLHTIFPSMNPHQPKSYLDLDVLRCVVTVFDLVAIVLIIIIGIVTMIKVGFTLVRSALPPGGVETHDGSK